MQITFSLRNIILTGFLYKVMERLGVQIINFIVMIVLTRILTPEDYGLFFIGFSIIGVLEVFVTYGYGSSLIANKNSDNIDFSTCFYFALVFSSIVYFFLLFFAENIAGYFNEDQLIPVIQAMGIYLPLIAINTVQQSYVSKSMMFEKSFFSASIGAVLSGIIAFFMASMGYGVWALVAQFIGKVVFDIIYLWIALKWRPMMTFSFRRLKGIFDFGWKILAIGLIDRVYGELKNFVIAKRYSNDDLAFSNKGAVFPQAIMGVLEAAIGAVMFPVLSQYQDDKERMKNLVRKTIMMSSFIVFPLMVGLCMIAEPLVIVLFTEKWLPCTVFLQLSCLDNILRPLQFINVCAVKSLGRSDILLELNILKKFLGITLLIIGCRYGVIGVVLSFIVTDLISTIINIAPTGKELKYGYKEQTSDITKSAISALLMGGGMHLITFWNCWGEYLILLQISVGFLVYITMSYFLKNESIFYGKNIILSFVNKL